MKEDNLGFPAGILLVVFTYTILWAVYSWAYATGYEANKCIRKHGYNYSNTLFMGSKK